MSHRVLVIGNGAREHALAHTLKQSPHVSDVFAAPGNAGIAELATCVPIESSSIIELADFAAEVNVSLAVVGPELPLVLGIVDEFHKRDLKIFGPTAAAAELEGSKVFAKQFMQANGIPTAGFEVASSREEAAAILAARDRFPVVLKADGLAGGKGVFVCPDRAAADEALTRLMDERVFGKAAERIVIEDCLQGTELSFQVLADGRAVVPLAVARDYKRARDGGAGPNTGGMGAVSPSRTFSSEAGRVITHDIVQPTIKALAEDGRPFTGVLYCGLMLTADGPKVLEYNVRFGDPETQSVLPRLDSDLFELLLAAANGKLDGHKVAWKKTVSASVVLAAKGYPEAVETGQTIHGLDAVKQLPVTVFHAGSRRDGDRIVTSAGRVLTVNACAPTRARACEVAYDAVSKISFDGMHYRRDIGSGEDKPTA